MSAESTVVSFGNFIQAYLRAYADMVNAEDTKDCLFSNFLSFQNDNAHRADILRNILRNFLISWKRVISLKCDIIIARYPCSSAFVPEISCAGINPLMLLKKRRRTILE